jgi:Putative lumazine-binding
MALLEDRVGASESDIESIRQVALDYLEGYVSGDAERHLSSYHPEAIKRRYSVGTDGVVGVITLSPQTMADDAALQTPQPVEAEIIVDAVYDDIASVRVYSPWWVDFVHVVKARGDWKLFHVTWHRRDDDLT